MAERRYGVPSADEHRQLVEPSEDREDLEEPATAARGRAAEDRAVASTTLARCCGDAADIDEDDAWNFDETAVPHAFSQNSTGTMRRDACWWWPTVRGGWYIFRYD